MAGFKYEKKGDKAEKIGDIIEKHSRINYDILDHNAKVRAGKLEADILPERPEKEVIAELKEAGLSYRRTDMLADIRRHASSDRSLDDEARQRALDWHDNVYEKIRQDFGNLNSKQATALWQAIVDQSYYDFEYDPIDLADIWDLYKEA